MGYVIPVAYSFHTPYLERFHTAKPLNSRVELLSGSNKYRAYHQSEQDEKRKFAHQEFPNQFGQFIDIKV